jgi:hypothetical protein
MARYATTDPSLSSLAADRRQGLHLIAPPNAKRRRTVKKVLVELKILYFLDYKITLFLINHIFVHFQTRAPQPSEPVPANAPSTGMTFTVFS